jgi:hypothetical protein
MSFVLYLKVPYLIEDEMLKGPGKESNYNSSGFFSFHYTNSLGELQNHRIDTDETYENCMIMFPSKMMHSVSPFYTSDEYRISVSGNFVFDNKV